jgi:hypothetical protein
MCTEMFLAISFLSTTVVNAIFYCFGLSNSVFLITNAIAMRADECKPGSGHGSGHNMCIEVKMEVDMNIDVGVDVGQQQCDETTRAEHLWPSKGTNTAQAGPPDARRRRAACSF